MKECPPCTKDRIYISTRKRVSHFFSPPDAYASSSIFARNERLLVPVYIRISNSEDASGEIRTTFLFLFPPIFMPFHKFLLPSQEQNSPLVDRWSNVFHYIFYSLLIEIIIDLQNLIFEILLSEAKEEEEEEKVRESRWILSRVKRKEDSNGA